MSTPAPAIDAQARELASRIYVDLLRNAVVVSATGAQVTGDPKSLAKTSFKLAELFQQVENELNAESLPKNQDFKVDIADIAAWTHK